METSTKMNLRLLNMPTDLLHLKHDTHVHPSYTSQSRNKWDLLNLFSGGKGTQPLQQLVALLRRTVIDASGPNKQAVYSRRPRSAGSQQRCSTAASSGDGGSACKELQGYFRQFTGK